MKLTLTGVLGPLGLERNLVALVSDNVTNPLLVPVLGVVVEIVLFKAEDCFVQRVSELPLARAPAVCPSKPPFMLGNDPITCCPHPKFENSIIHRMLKKCKAFF
jgi:hypothetical protein